MTCASVCTPPHLSVGTHPTNPTQTTPRPPCEATYLTDPQWLVLLPRNTHPVAKPPNATKSHTLTNSTPSKTSKNPPPQSHRCQTNESTNAKRTKAPTPQHTLCHTHQNSHTPPQPESQPVDTADTPTDAHKTRTPPEKYDRKVETQSVLKKKSQSIA